MLEAGSTASDAIAGVQLSGRVAVITGASGGIGLETARAFASAGAHVVLGNRPSAKSDAAIDELRTSLPHAHVDVEALDLTSLASVRAFAQRVLDQHPRVDLLVNNAGVMAVPFARTADGFESQLGINHLSHFLLTNLLVPALVAAAPARVVNLSSNAHGASDILWDDLNYHSRPYNPWQAYGQSKTANVLFTVELERRLAPLGVHAYAVHPGLVGTDLMRYLSDKDREVMDSRITSSHLAYKSPQQGAATSVWAATSPQLAVCGGAYLEDCQVSKKYTPYARDPEAAQRLWSISEELVGQSFPAR